jgi:lysylphosphatidylglycerol synthetase-like protein (DUF2156 family)
MCQAGKDAKQEGAYLDSIASWLDKGLIVVGILGMFQPPLGVELTTALAMFDAAITLTSKVLLWMGDQGNSFWSNKNAVTGALLGMVAIPGIIYSVGLVIAASTALATFLSGSPEAEPLLLPFTGRADYRR